MRTSTDVRCLNFPWQNHNSPAGQILTDAAETLLADSFLTVPRPSWPLDLHYPSILAVPDAVPSPFAIHTAGLAGEDGSLSFSNGVLPGPFSHSTSRWNASSDVKVGRVRDVAEVDGVNVTFCTRKTGCYGVDHHSSPPCPGNAAILFC